MIRTISALSAALAAVTLLPAAGAAQNASGYYTAVPVSAAAEDSHVTRSIVWHCGTEGCTAAKSSSRDAIVCQLIVREVGALSQFSVEGRAFAAEDLERCNSRARS